MPCHIAQLAAFIQTAVFFVIADLLFNGVSGTQAEVPVYAPDHPAQLNIKQVHFGSITALVSQTYQKTDY
jgi:hypothetical protein